MNSDTDWAIKREIGEPNARMSKGEWLVWYCRRYLVNPENPRNKKGEIWKIQQTL